MKRKEKSRATLQNEREADKEKKTTNGNIFIAQREEHAKEWVIPESESWLFSHSSMTQSQLLGSGEERRRDNPEWE